MANFAVLIETPSCTDAVIPCIDKNAVNTVKTIPINHLDRLEAKALNLFNFRADDKLPMILNTYPKINNGKMILTIR